MDGHFLSSKDQESCTRRIVPRKALTARRNAPSMDPVGGEHKATRL